MRRALQLAKSGKGEVLPNPSVGCVIVYKGQIIGEGFTSAYGGPHAEVNAINSVADKTLLTSATLYVTLEPCSHYGQTPPCADLIVANKIPRVVVGIKDPNLKVSGKGIQKLETASCEVISGIMEEQCREHHRRFLTYQEKKRPYIILKWAETKDGFIAPSAKKRAATPEPFWITNRKSRQLVHQWRSEEQAILVGTNTVLQDNPKLNVREWEGKDPIRVVLDRGLKITSDFHVLDKSTLTLVLTEAEDASRHLKGINYEVIRFSKDLIMQVVTKLYQNKITSVLVEGGAQTLQSFIDAGLWDEARVFVGNRNFKEGIKAPKFLRTPERTEQIDSDILTLYSND